MTKLQTKIQKYIILSTIIVMACLIIYALGFYTPFAPLQYIEDYIDGAKVYFEQGSIVQAFNRHLLLIGIVGMIVCILFYLFDTTKRKIYYFSNYIISIVYFLISSYIFYFMIVNLPQFRTYFLSLPFEQCDEHPICSIAMEDIWYTTSPFIFDLGIAVAFIVLLSGLSVVVYAIVKYRNNQKMLQDRKQLKKELGVS